MHMDRIYRLTIVANPKKPDVKELLEQIGRILHEHDVAVIYEKRLGELVGEEGVELIRAIDESQMLLVLGGDGTMLSVARRTFGKEIPLLGVNLGHLGFLTQLVPEEIEKALPAIIKGEYTLTKRMMLRGAIEGKSENLYALNEICIEGGESIRLLELRTYISDQFVSSYYADGILVSTPTGSTAYSMAAGGSIVTPNMGAFLITPLSPYSLSIRPMIVGDGEAVRIEIVSGAGVNPRIIVDGQEIHQFEDTQAITIRKADFYSHFINYSNRSFYEVLRTKLGWGNPPGMNKRQGGGSTNEN